MEKVLLCNVATATKIEVEVLLPLPDVTYKPKHVPSSVVSVCSQISQLVTYRDKGFEQKRRHTRQQSDRITWLHRCSLSLEFLTIVLSAHKSHCTLGRDEGRRCSICFHCQLRNFSALTVLNPTQLRWQTKTTNHSTSTPFHYQQRAPHVNQAHTNVSMHTHTWQRAEWKSQTCPLICTKSAPIWLYLSFVISAGAGEWQEVRRVRLLFQHLLKGRCGRRGGGARQSKGEVDGVCVCAWGGLLLLNPWTFHTPAPLLWSSWKSFFLYSFLFTTFPFL